MEWSIQSLDRPERLTEWQALQNACECSVGIDAGLLAQLARHGGWVLGVAEQGRLRGAAVAVLGGDSRSDRRVAQARLKVHLVALLVDPAWRRRGIATTLMLGLRRAAELDGLPLITWEMDPLDSRTASLSFHRLGASSSAWVGAWPEGEPDLRRGRPIEVDWWLRSRRVQARASASRPDLALAHYLEAGAQQVNPAGLDARGLPTPSLSPDALDGALILLEVVADLPGLLKKDPELASAWRLQVDALLEQAYAGGYLVTDFLTLEQEAFPRAYLVLAAGESTLG